MTKITIGMRRMVRDESFARVVKLMVEAEEEMRNYEFNNRRPRMPRVEHDDKEFVPVKFMGKRSTLKG